MSLPFNVGTRTHRAQSVRDSSSRRVDSVTSFRIKKTPFKKTYPLARYLPACLPVLTWKTLKKASCVSYGNTWTRSRTKRTICAGIIIQACRDWIKVSKRKNPIEKLAFHRRVASTKKTMAQAQTGYGKLYPVQNGNTTGYSEGAGLKSQNQRKFAIILLILS